MFSTAVWGPGAKAFWDRPAKALGNLHLTAVKPVEDPVEDGVFEVICDLVNRGINKGIKE